MNKFLSVLRTLLLPILFVSLAFVACEGPAGAKGDAGATGPQGPAGPAGPSGAEQCGVCHNNGSALFQKSVQWEESLHGTGDIYIYGNRSGCLECHTSQGFKDYLTNGTAPTTPYNDVSSINCRTCHNIHVKYDATDWALTKTTEVKFYETAAPKATADLKKGNLCGQCHQARATTPAIDVNSTANYEITSSRFGGHHSPVANVFANNIAFVPKGSATIPTSNAHTAAPEGCPTCHMSEPPVLHGAVLGGHTWKMASDDGTLQNFAACTQCHPSATSSFDNIGGKFFSTFAADLHKADSIFQVKKWRDANGAWIGPNGKSASSSNKLVVTQNQAAAIYCYQLLLEDKSNGVHNPAYARAILNNILEEISK